MNIWTIHDDVIYANAAAYALADIAPDAICKTGLTFVNESLKNLALQAYLEYADLIPDGKFNLTAFWSKLPETQLVPYVPALIDCDNKRGRTRLEVLRCLYVRREYLAMAQLAAYYLKYSCVAVDTGRIDVVLRLKHPTEALEVALTTGDTELIFCILIAEHLRKSKRRLNQTTLAVTASQEIARWRK